jgi:anti-sigma factor RsiW
MDAPEVTCSELVEHVTAYLEQALRPFERARLEQHLQTCPPCQAHLEQMRDTLMLLGRVPEHRLSAAARRDLLVAFRGWKRAGAPRRAHDGVTLGTPRQTDRRRDR